MSRYEEPKAFENSDHRKEFNINKLNEDLQLVGIQPILLVFSQIQEKYIFLKVDLIQELGSFLQTSQIRSHPLSSPVSSQESLSTKLLSSLKISILGQLVALVSAVTTVPGIFSDKKKVQHFLSFISSVSPSACKSLPQLYLMYAVLNVTHFLYYPI